MRDLKQVASQTNMAKPPRKTSIFTFTVGLLLFNAYWTLHLLRHQAPDYFRLRGSQRTPFTPSDFGDTDFSLKADTEGDFPLIGSSVKYVAFDNSKLVDIHDRPGVVEVRGAAFNLALLRLPPGSKWTFVGTARSPELQGEYLKTEGNGSRRQDVIAFGLNLTSDGQLEIVTDGQILDIPTAPIPRCIGILIPEIFGPEDARLFWTDAGTPGMTLGIGGTAEGYCRTMAFVPDLRALYDDLSDAIKVGGTVKAFEARYGPGEGVAQMHELHRKTDHRSIEKNWMPFYPGAVPNSSALYPNLHYSLSPDEALQMVEKQPRRLVYDTITSHRYNPERNCIVRHHPFGDTQALHHATPLYRLTMCARGCAPTDENTVYISMGHITLFPSYSKFSVLYSLTEPFKPISVGPIFRIPGLDDKYSVNYVMTLQPITRGDLDTELPKPVFRKDTMPDHFFVDDMVLMTMGQNDGAMLSTMIAMEDILGGHRSCVH